MARTTGRLVTSAALTASLAALVLLAACSIHEEGSKESKNKKVSIETPFGKLKVNTDADAGDAGMAVYPGAHRIEHFSDEPNHDQHDTGSANVNIDTSLFGVKVVAVKYGTDDPPDKVLGFYKKELEKYGKVLECKGDIHEDKPNHELKCYDKPGRDETELAVGVPERQHIVAVKPRGNGSEFALVYVQTRGDEKETM